MDGLVMAPYDKIVGKPASGGVVPLCGSSLLIP